MNQSVNKDYEPEEPRDCLRMEVQNISKEEINYQTRDLKDYRNKSYISVPGSCDSIIEIQNNSLMQIEDYADIMIENQNDGQQQVQADPASLHVGQPAEAETDTPQFRAGQLNTSRNQMYGLNSSRLLSPEVRGKKNENNTDKKQQMGSGLLNSSKNYQLYGVSNSKLNTSKMSNSRVNLNNSRLNGSRIFSPEANKMNNSRLNVSKLNLNNSRLNGSRIFSPEAGRVKKGDAQAAAKNT